MRERHYTRQKDDQTRPNHYFRFLCLTALTTAAATAIYFAVNSNAAATAATGGAAVAKAALAAAAATSSLVPLIALTLLVGSIILLPFLFRGNAFHVRPPQETVFLGRSTGPTLFVPSNVHGHERGFGGFGSGHTVVVDSHQSHGHGGQRHVDHGHGSYDRSGLEHKGHGHDPYTTTTDGYGGGTTHRRR